MKKTFTSKIIVFVTLSLITAAFALAQEQTRQAPADLKQADAERKQMEAEMKQIEATQKQIEAAEKQMQDAQKQMAVAQEQMEMNKYKMLEDYISVPRVNIPVWQRREGGGILVIPAAELKVEDLAAITEDMSVMSRIFDNKLIQARLTTAPGGWFVGFDPFSGRDSGTIEALYLEGYAALFLMKVNFPLSPPAEEKEEKETEEADTDPLWNQTKKEMFAPEDVRTRRTERPEEKYDAQKVAELKETLIKTLKHAANIRALKPDQSVILTVIGGQSQSGMRTTTQLYGRSGMSSNISIGRSSMGRSIGRRLTGTETVALPPTVLTICAKKSDIDAFARGELSFDQFRERTSIFSSYAKVADAGLSGIEEQPIAKARPPVF